VTPIDALFGGKGGAVIWLDDNIGTHRKTLKAGAEASWLWASALCYCRRHLTDGHVPTEALPTLGRFQTPVETLAKQLVDARLFERADKGFVVHDYLKHNDSRATVEGLRAKEKARKAAYRSQRPAGVPPGQARDTTPCPAGTPLSSRARVSVPIPITSTYPPDPPTGGTREKRTPTPTEARRMAHDRALRGEKPWRARCRARGHEPPCEKPNDCNLLEMKGGV
jgi:hypothetical protein